MEISSNTSSIQALTPRTQNLPVAEAEDVGSASAQTPTTAEPASAEQNATPRPEPQVESAAPTTDLNELLLRNEGSQQSNTLEQPSQPQAENAQPQDRELQRNQLEDRFNALTNDAPSPNIDIST